MWKVQMQARRPSVAFLRKQLYATTMTTLSFFVETPHHFFFFFCSPVSLVLGLTVLTKLPTHTNTHKYT